MCSGGGGWPTAPDKGCRNMADFEQNKYDQNFLAIKQPLGRNSALLTRRISPSAIET
jgi:hypothetical protein